MKEKTNYWSLVFAFVCIALFFIFTSSKYIAGFSTAKSHLYLLLVILALTLADFFVGLIGFSAATNWKRLLRSVITTVITAGLTSIIGYLLFFAVFWI